MIIAIAAVAAFALALALILGETLTPDSGDINADSYADELAAALSGADADIGEKLIKETDCATCHLTGDGSAAPQFAGIGSIAGARRPPLDAEQYLYEAIVLPAAHLVDGYANAMPSDYGQRLSAQEIGHMIAYLLTLTGE
ncbi:MAG: c-type cytochrome [Chloroflexi bacterium]|nr:c-type cytochrome [Chloroflexota bacterium]